MYVYDDKYMKNLRKIIIYAAFLFSSAHFLSAAFVIRFSPGQYAAGPVRCGLTAYPV